MLDTRTKLHAAIPADRRACSKDASFSRCLPTPLVKNSYVGTKPSTSYSNARHEPTTRLPGSDLHRREPVPRCQGETGRRAPHCQTSGGVIYDGPLDRRSMGSVVHSGRGHGPLWVREGSNNEGLRHAKH